MLLAVDNLQAFISLPFEPLQSHRKQIRSKKRCPLFACAEGNGGSGGYSRRQFTLLSISSILYPSSLLAKDDLHASLSRFASRIPGLGQPDIFYPSYFEGDWDVRREYISIKTPQGADRVNDDFLKELSGKVGHVDEYRASFIEHRGDVVQDRAYSARYELMAELGRPPKDIEVVWDVDNPNVLSLSAPPSCNREVKVTKRAFEAERGGKGSFEEREFARVVEVFGEDGLLGQGREPRIYGRRRVIKYRIQEGEGLRDAQGVPQVLVALCVDYGYPSQGFDTDKPTTILKSRILYRRRKQNESTT